MADAPQTPTAQLRAKVRAAEKALEVAEARESALKKALAESPTDEKRAEHDAAVAARVAAADALEDAHSELENFADDERDANDNDPIPPQTDYRLREIVAKLSHYRQRATYGAVGDFLHASAAMARQWFSGRESMDNSFVVSAMTGEPTNYPVPKIHPALKSRPEILRTSDDLLVWLQSHPVKFR